MLPTHFASISQQPGFFKSGKLLALNMRNGVRKIGPRSGSGFGLGLALELALGGNFTRGQFS